MIIKISYPLEYASDYVYGRHVYKWFNFVQNVFNETGFTDVLLP